MGLAWLLLALLPARSNAQSVVATAVSDHGIGSIVNSSVRPLSPVPLVAAFERFGRTDEVDLVVSGRLLLTELSCTACHASDDEGLAAKAGPRLDAAGSRLQGGWIERFLLDPQAVHPGTTMPNMLHSLADQRRLEVAEALTAYLLSLQKPLPEVRGTGAVPVPHEFWLRGEVVAGSQLYHRVGCVACHAGDDDYETVETVATGLDQMLELLDEQELADLGLLAAARPGPVQPLGRLGDKYSAHSLTLFLLNPTETRPAGRMPHMNLTPTEAADIAAYLLQRTRPSAGKVGPAGQPAGGGSSAVPAGGDPDQRTAADHSPAEQQEKIDLGRLWFAQLRCAQCHETGDRQLAADQASLPSSPPLHELSTSGGCLAAAAASAATATTTTVIPQYGLDSPQQEALTAALWSLHQTPPPTADAANPATQPLLATLLQLNCLACHQRGDLGGVARDRRPFFETVNHEDLGDEGRFPPPLSRVEEKLQPQWLARVLQGGGRIRPHMHARMPQIAAPTAKRLERQFAESLELTLDQSSNATDRSSNAAASVVADSRFPEDEHGVEAAMTAGRALMDVGCIQCHRYSGESLPGVIGVDLAAIGQRLRPAWFYRFLCDPGALKPRTRMPNFFPDGQSLQPEILGGDRDRQIAAIWAYLNDLGNQPLPAKIEQARAADFELRPVDAPLLLRTFMPQARTRAIAVGFPAAVHAAVDVEAIRLAALWRGRFLDAQGTWFVRSAPPAAPLGVDLWNLPPGSDFHITPLAGQNELAAGQSSLAGQAPTAAAAPAASPPSTSGGVPAVPGIQTPFRGYRLDERGVPEFQYQIGDFIVFDRLQPQSPQATDTAAAAAMIRTFTIMPAAGDWPPSQLWLRVLGDDQGGPAMQLPESLAQQHHRLDDRDGEFVPLAPPPASSTAAVPDAPRLTWEIIYRW